MCHCPLFVELQAHRTARLFINKTIENYEDLRIICREDNAMGSSATLFFEFKERSENENNNNDNVEST